MLGNWLFSLPLVPLAWQRADLLVLSLFDLLPLCTDYYHFLHHIAASIHRHTNAIKASTTSGLLPKIITTGTRNRHGVEFEIASACRKVNKSSFVRFQLECTLADRKSTYMLTKKRDNLAQRSKSFLLLLARAVQHLGYT